MIWLKEIALVSGDVALLLGIYFVISVYASVVFVEHATALLILF